MARLRHIAKQQKAPEILFQLFHQSNYGQNAEHTSTVHSFTEDLLLREHVELMQLESSTLMRS